MSFYMQCADFGSIDSLTIYDVEALERTLMQTIDSHSSFKLDLSETSAIDGAGVQWLKHFIWLVEREGKTWSIPSLSQIVIENAELAGLTRKLQEASE